jgi:hypothetical protein
MRRFLLIALLLVATTAHAQASDDPLTARLVEINKAVRGSYAEEKARRLAMTDPVMVVAFDELIFRHKGQEKRENFTPPLYHQLKGIAHIPLGIYAVLAAPARGEDNANWRPALAALRAQIAAIEPLLDDLKLRRKDLRRQHEIIGDCLAFIDTVIAAGRVSQDELHDFTSAISPAILANAYDASEQQLEGLHALVTRWRAELSDDEWQRLFVVVLGPKVARTGNAQLEYFAYAMGRETIDTRLIYAEGMFAVPQGLDLLATLVRDRNASDYFFDDPLRLDRDLLADAAQLHLKRIFGIIPR